MTITPTRDLSTRPDLPFPVHPAPFTLRIATTDNVCLLGPGGGGATFGLRALAMDAVDSGWTVHAGTTVSVDEYGPLRPLLRTCAAGVGPVRQMLLDVAATVDDHDWGPPGLLIVDDAAPLFAETDSRHWRLAPDAQPAAGWPSALLRLLDTPSMLVAVRIRRATLLPPEVRSRTRARVLLATSAPPQVRAAFTGDHSLTRAYKHPPPGAGFIQIGSGPLLRVRPRGASTTQSAAFAVARLTRGSTDREARHSRV